MSTAPVIKSFISVLAAVMIAAPALYSATLNADPDHIASGYEFRGTACIRIGDQFYLPHMSTGGMIEVRNEEQFTQRILPNHNWRGFFYIYGHLNLFSEGSTTTHLSAGFEHESAHPVAGLIEPYRDLYDTLYDGTYRNINLNSFMVRINHSTGGDLRLNFLLDLQFYFLSRNTPELPWNDLGWSEGMSGGAELMYTFFTGWDLFLSVFDRYIFRGTVEKKGLIWEKQGGSFIQVEEDYPVIRNINTLSARAGIIFRDLVPGGAVSVYCGILRGNIYGFTDSRDIRTGYSAGIEFIRH